MARITNALRHTHKYFRMPATGLWYCAGIDGCTHYMHKNMPEPVGRMSLCWGCNKPFQLAPYNMTEDKPQCDTCQEKMEVIESWLEEKLNPAITPVKNHARAAEKAQTRTPTPVTKEPDQIEVIEQDIDPVIHDDDCDVWKGYPCSCQ